MTHKPHLKFLAWALLVCFGWLSVQTQAYCAPIAAPVAPAAALPVSNLSVPIALEVAQPSSDLENLSQTSSPIRKSTSATSRASLAADLLKDAAEDAGEVVTAGLSLGGSVVGQLTLPGVGHAVGGFLGAALGGAVQGMALAAIERRSGNDFWFEVWRSIGKAIAKHRVGLPLFPGAGGSLAEIFVRAADRLGFPTQSSRDFVGGLKLSSAAVLSRVDLIPKDLGSFSGRFHIKEGNLNRAPRSSDVHAQGPPGLRSAYEISFLASSSIHPASFLAGIFMPGSFGLIQRQIETKTKTNRRNKK